MLQEFAARNAWSLHNAFTGAAKAMPMTTRLPAIQALGKFFGMSTEGGVPAPTPNSPLPNLPCPNCGKNLLVEGFFNSCTETTRVHEDNRAYIVNDHLCVDHDEETLDTIDHECELEAYCSSCEKLLPWALYEIRELDGVKLSEAPAAIAELLAELEGDSQIASA